MANAFNWQITAVEVTPQVGNLQDVVNKICWRRVVDDGTNEADVCGSTLVELNPDDPFVDYQHLTPKIMEGWIEAAFEDGMLANIDSKLEEKLAAIVNPQVVQKPLPWENVVLPGANNGPETA